MEKKSKYEKSSEFYNIWFINIVIQYYKCIHQITNINRFNGIYS